MHLLKKHLSSAILVLIPLLIFGCNSEVDTEDPLSSKSVRPVKLLNIETNQNSQLLSFPALIQAGETSQLAFQVSGVVASVNVTESMEVDKGDVLATLDASNYQTQLDVAKAEYTKSNSEYQRTKKLFEKGIVAQIKLEASKAQKDIHKAQLTTAQKAVNDATLTAPYAGNISSVELKKKQTIQQGEAVISLLSLSMLEAIINLPSSIVANAKESNGDNPIYIVLNAAPNQKIPAFIKEVSLKADHQSQTYAVTFNFEPQQGLNILPGMNARVFFQDPTKESTKAVISVPMGAIAKQGNDLYVWVLDDNSMTVSKRIIEIASEANENITVTSGLMQGETIVTAGVSFLSEGMTVRPWIKN